MRAPGGRGWPGAESNCRHRDFQSRALPTELPGRTCGWAEKYRGAADCGERAQQDPRLLSLVSRLPSLHLGHAQAPTPRTHMHTRLFTTIGLAATALCLNPLAAGPLMAQDTGTIQGTVTRSDNSAKILGANVSVKGTGLEALTGTGGRFTLQRVPPGEHTLL